MLKKHWRIFKKTYWDEYKKGLLLLLFAALSIRLVYLFEIRNCEAFENLIGDAVSYDLWAQEISTGNWLGNRLFYQSPFYPYFLGIIYSVFGRDLFLVRIIQVLMGSLSCIFLAGAGGSFFNKTTGLVGGLMLALYPTAIFFDGCIQKTSSGLFLMTLLLLLLGKINHNPKSLLWFFCGLVLGCLGLVRENSLFLLFIILFWLHVHFKNMFWKNRTLWTCCFVLGLLMVLLPVGIRNKIVGNHFVLTTSQFGTNFYIGNNKTADGLYRALAWSRGDWSYESIDATRLAEEETGRPLDPTEVSSFWFKKALSDIRSRPFSWIRLMFKKWGLLWNATEIGDTDSQYAYYDWSFLLNFFGKLFHFGVLCPLAVSGLLFTWERRRHLWALYLVLFGYAASISLFYIFARYRVPMIPVLTLFAAAGLLKSISIILERKVKKFLLWGGVVLISGIAVNQVKIPSSYFAATTYSNLASRLEPSRPDKAHAFYLKAIHLNPFFVKAYFRLGCFQMRQGEFDNALKAFSRALILDPGNGVIHYHIGLSYLETDKPNNALYHFQEAVRTNSDFNPMILYKMAVTQAVMNNTDKALSLLKKAAQQGFMDVKLVLNEKTITPQTKYMFVQTIKEEYEKDKRH